MRLGSRLFPALFLLAPIVTAIAPRLAPLVLLLLAGALLVAAWRQGFSLREVLRPNVALTALLLFSLYTFINSSWALDQGEAFGKSGTLLGAILVAFAGTQAAAVLEGPQVRRAAIAFVIGAGIAAIYVLVEVLSEGALTGLAMNFISALRPEHAKHMRIVDGDVVRISPSEFNQQVSLVMLNLWPGLLIVAALPGLTRRLAAIVAFCLALVVPVVVSDHDSSQVALIISALVLLLAWRWRTAATIKALAVLWCFTFALVIPADFVAYNADLHLAKWLPNSARARIIIWQYTAERALEQPVLGIGVNSTSALRDKEKKLQRAEQPKGFVFTRSTGQHAHDIFLQTWFELGLIGVILLAAAGAAVVLRIGALPLLAQPFALATFAAFAGIAAFAWGMWQTWFMCAVGLAPLYLRLAASAIDVQPARRKPRATQ